ncbi:GNAT family N-acetyltransferase [Rothia sp. ZJ932]|nr:GNAT family N-acetyltransferase [Rothia sp. ZJ932]
MCAPLCRTCTLFLSQPRSHLAETFYTTHGFRRVSEPYLEDDIPHVDMELTL